MARSLPGSRLLAHWPLVWDSYWLPLSSERRWPEQREPSKWPGLVRKGLGPKLARPGRQTLQRKPEEPKAPLAKLLAAVKPLELAKAKARAQVLLMKLVRVQPSRRLLLPGKRREVWAWPTRSEPEKREREKRPARPPEQARQRGRGKVLLRAQAREPRTGRAKVQPPGSPRRLAIPWMGPRIWAWPTRSEAKAVKASAPGMAPRQALVKYLLTSQRDGGCREHGSSTSTT